MIKKLQKKVSPESLDSRVKSLDNKIEGIDNKMKNLDDGVKRVEESQRKTGVQLDGLEHKFDLCIEGFGSLNERTNKLEDRVGVLEDNR